MYTHTLASREPLTLILATNLLKETRHPENKQTHAQSCLTILVKTLIEIMHSPSPLF